MRALSEVARLARSAGDWRKAKARSKARTALGLLVHDAVKSALAGLPGPLQATDTDEATMERWTMALAQSRGMASVKRAQDRTMVALARQAG